MLCDSVFLTFCHHVKWWPTHCLLALLKDMICYYGKSVHIYHKHISCLSECSLCQWCVVVRYTGQHMKRTRYCCSSGVIILNIQWCVVVRYTGQQMKRTIYCCSSGVIILNIQWCVVVRYTGQHMKRTRYCCSSWFWGHYFKHPVMCSSEVYWTADETHKILL